MEIHTVAFHAAPAKGGRGLAVRRRRRNLPEETYILRDFICCVV